MPPANSLDENTGELQPNLAQGSARNPCLLRDPTVDRLYPVLGRIAKDDYYSNMERRGQNGVVETTTNSKKPAPTSVAGQVSLIRYIPRRDSDLNCANPSVYAGSLPILSPIMSAKMGVCAEDRIIPLSEASPECYSGGDAKLAPPTKVSQTSLMITDSCASLVPTDGDGLDNGNSTQCNPCTDNPNLPSESLLMMVIQVFIPFLIAGFGMVGAGLVLDTVQHWPVFEDITAIYIVVPPLLGLKGNLEMTLASRLSTLANLGNIDSKQSLLPYVGGNMLISQCLASGIGFITSIVAVIIDSISNDFRLPQSLVLIAASVATAALSSFLLDSIMVSVIIASRRVGINPDNVATPIAASLGDITTISLLAGIGSGLYMVIDRIEWIGPVVALPFLILVPLWIFIAWRHEYTAQALKTTFIPVLGAMFISTGGGFILSNAVTQFKDIAVFQPIINGVGGNLVAIQASRIATSLHQQCPMGTLPSSHSSVCVHPLAVFIGRDSHSRCAQVLMLMVIPGQLIFVYTTSFISTGQDSLSIMFVIVYLIAALLQVGILLYVATLATYMVWRKKIDPDNFSIPLLTALGDLLGIGLLFIAFLFLQWIGEPLPSFSLTRLRKLYET